MSNSFTRLLSRYVERLDQVSLRVKSLFSPARRRVATFNCPHCGAEVPVTAPSCRECGSDDETGWSEAADSYGAHGGYDDEFDYDEFVSKEFPGYAHESTRDRLKTWGVRAILFLVCLAMLLQMFG
ncbi:MAG: hypothetical protein KDA92_06750 [Planctomycetales bacterium]|nr:hypothetical protein [Planctomycetales bacterium]